MYQMKTLASLHCVIYLIIIMFILKAGEIYRIQTV